MGAAETALRLNPNLSMVYAARAQVTWGTIPGRGVAAWDESMADLSHAIENDARNSTALAWRAEDYASLGYLDRAVQDYQRCLDIDPAYGLCRQHLAEVYLCLGRTAEALRLYEVLVQDGYVSGNVIFAPAIAARGDRLGALGALAADSPGDLQLIRPLFRILTDPTFSERDRQEAVALAVKSTFIQRFDPTPLWILKAYDKMDPSFTNGDPPIWWMRNDAAWLKSPSRKQLMQHWHLPDYWRTHGFPPQCRPIGQSDFECP